MSLELAFLLFLVVVPFILFWVSLLNRMMDRIGVKGLSKWTALILMGNTATIAFGLLILALAVPPVHPAQKRADDLEKEVAALQQQVERNVKYIKTANLEINKLRRQVELLQRSR